MPAQDILPKCHRRKYDAGISSVSTATSGRKHSTPAGKHSAGIRCVVIATDFAIIHPPIATGIRKLMNSRRNFLVVDSHRQLWRSPHSIERGGKTGYWSTAGALDARWTISAQTIYPRSRDGSCAASVPISYVDLQALEDLAGIPAEDLHRKR